METLLICLLVSAAAVETGTIFADGLTVTTGYVIDFGLCNRMK
jgi:hypothetical protein